MAGELPFAEAGDVLRSAAARAGLRPGEVAGALGLSPAAVSRYFSGGLRPSEANIHRLAALLDLDPSRLFVTFGLLPHWGADTATLQDRYPREKLLTSGMAGGGVVSPFSVCWGPGLLGQTDVTVTRDSRRYRIPPFVDRVRDQLRLPRGRRYNRTKARLVQMQDTGRGLQLRFQRATYLDYLLTNHQVLVGATVYRDSEWVLLADLLEPPGGCLSRLDASLCANHLGLNALLLDRDGRLILSQRSAEFGFAYLPGASYGLSVAGSMDWSDESPFAGIKREMEEEIVVSDDEVNRLWLTAIARNIARGGKPEAFFVGQLTVSCDEISRRLSASSRPESTAATEDLPPQDLETRRVFGRQNAETPVLDLIAGGLDYTPETKAGLALFLQVRDAVMARLRSSTPHTRS